MKRSIKITIGVAAAVLVIGGGVTAAEAAGGHGASQPVGYHNVRVLEASMLATLNAGYRQLDSPNYGDHLDSVTCIVQTRTTDSCLGQFSDGTNATVTVTISADGKSWVS